MRTLLLARRCVLFRIVFEFITHGVDARLFKVFFLFPVSLRCSFIGCSHNEIHLWLRNHAAHVKLEPFAKSFVFLAADRCRLKSPYTSAAIQKREKGNLMNFSR